MNFVYGMLLGEFVVQLLQPSGVGFVGVMVGTAIGGAFALRASKGD